MRQQWSKSLLPQNPLLRKKRLHHKGSGNRDPTEARALLAKINRPGKVNPKAKGKPIVHRVKAVRPKQAPPLVVAVPNVATALLIK